MNPTSDKYVKKNWIYWLLVVLLLIKCFPVVGQISWDDTTKNKWKKPFQRVSILSKIDQTKQPAYFYASTSKDKQPLIVSLHSWSGSFEQVDSIAEECVQRNWNYIHPHFRGENSNPQAAGSALVIADIQEAISFAIEKGHVDTNEIHIIGASGGGHAAMMCYFLLPTAPKSIHSWVGISDLEEWYWESLGRKQKYANDLLKIASENQENKSQEWRKRSPMFQTPDSNKSRTKLYLYAGIHDGYQGSVPISHSIRLYNKLAAFWKPNQPNNLVPDSTLIHLLTRRYSPERNSFPFLSSRPVHLFKKSGPVSLVIFEGKHEAIAEASLSLIVTPYDSKPLAKIVCLGDSNGENPIGWVNNLYYKLPTASILNFCKSGNTFGFFNNGNSKLNQLKNIDSVLQQAQYKFSSSQADFIIISLGTNDAKADFDSLQMRIPERINELLSKIKNHSIYSANTTKIIWVTPPPIKEELIQSQENLKKYLGASNRIKFIAQQIKNIAIREGDLVVDLQDLFSKNWMELQRDGIHYNKVGGAYAALYIANPIVQHLMVQQTDRTPQKKTVEVQGWNILSNDHQMAIQTIKTAKKFQINHLQLSHQILMDLKQLRDTIKQKQVNELIQEAKSSGINEVLLWDHALYQLSYYPSKFKRIEDGKLNFDDHEFWEWLKEDYRSLLDLCPNADGIVLTFIETGARAEHQFSKKYLSSQQKLAAVVEAIASVVCSERKKLLYIRTFGYTSEEYDQTMGCLPFLKNKEVRLMMKETPHDFFLTHPNNPYVEKVSRPTIIEFDCGNEFNGQGLIANTWSDHVSRRWRFFLKNPNIIGYVARTDRYFTSSILNTPNEVLLYALYKTTQDSSKSNQEILSSFITEKYGSAAIPYLIPAFQKSLDIVLGSLYTLGLNIANHSRLNFYPYASSYTRHVSGKWLNPPVVVVENGIHKEFHYWKDIVQHLSPAEFKAPDKGLKKDAPIVIDSNWVTPTENMNEEYLNYISLQKRNAVKVAYEALKLVQKTQNIIPPSSYDQLYQLFYRTWLTARLYEAVANSYFGFRVYQRGENFHYKKLERFIRIHLSQIKEISGEIGRYSFPIAKAEWDWKEDAVMAMKYYQDILNQLDY